MNSPEFPISAMLVDRNGIQDCDLRKSIQASVMVKKPPNIRLPRRKVLRFHMLEALIQQFGRFFVILPAPSVQYQQSVARPEARGIFAIPQNAGKDLLELCTGKGRQKPIRVFGCIFRIGNCKSFHIYNVKAGAVIFVIDVQPIDADTGCQGTSLLLLLLLLLLSL